MDEQNISLIDKVWNDKNFPSHPRREIGKDKDGKPIYQFYLDKGLFYTEGEMVYVNFISSEHKSMRYKFYFAKYNLDEYYTRHSIPLKGEFEMLIVGTEFIQ